MRARSIDSAKLHKIECTFFEPAEISGLSTNARGSVPSRRARGLRNVTGRTHPRTDRPVTSGRIRPPTGDPQPLSSTHSPETRRLTAPTTGSFLDPKPPTDAIRPEGL